MFNLVRDSAVTVASSVVTIASTLVIGVIGFWAYERFGVEEGYVESWCHVNMIQGGNCRFTVENKTSGRTCVKVSLTNKYNTSKSSSAVVCSGLVGPKETKNVAYTLDVKEVCNNDWDTCNFNVENR